MPYFPFGMFSCSARFFGRELLFRSVNQQTVQALGPYAEFAPDGACEVQVLGSICLGSTWFERAVMRAVGIYNQRPTMP